MEYKFSAKMNYEDYASGRVLYGSAGVPNFPVRLLNEIFRRGLTYHNEKTGLTVYDPCCGGGYLLTTLGLCNQSPIGKLIGSDIENEMVECAVKNLGLLSKAGLDNRIHEIETLINRYEKQSHIEAKESAIRLKVKLINDIPVSVFKADCLQPLPITEKVDLIITDIPYGNLVEWNDSKEDSIHILLERMYEIANESTIMAVVMDKKAKFSTDKWTVVEKNKIGKRKFVIMKKSVL